MIGSASLRLLGTPALHARWWAPVTRAALVIAGLLVAFWPTAVALATGALPGVTAGQGVLGMALVAVGVVAGVQDPRPHGVDIHDREMDAIVGSLLLAVAVGFTWLLPTQMGDLVPLWRPDLLGAAAFLAGALCLVVGVRTAGRCWPALVGLVMVHPVLVELALAPVMRSFTRMGAWLANALVAGGEAPPGASPDTIWLTDAGVFRALELEQSVSSFALVPLAALVLGATAVVLYGHYARRLLFVPIGTVLLMALLTARIAAGVLIARSTGGNHQWILGMPGTLLVLGVAGVGALLVARRLGLTWSPSTTAEHGGGRLSLLVAANILALGTLAIAVLGVPSHSELPSLYRLQGSSFAQAQSRDIDQLTAMATSEGDSPYPFSLAAGGWTRTEYARAQRTTAAAPLESPLVIDVIDVPDASMLSLYPPRELYGSASHERALHRKVTLAPGLEAVATTYLGANGKPEMSVLTWAWQAPDGTVQQVSMLTANDPVAAIPEPQVDFAGSLLPNVLDALRSPDIAVPEAAQAERDDQEATLIARARQMISATRRG